MIFLLLLYDVIVVLALVVDNDDGEVGRCFGGGLPFVCVREKEEEE